MITVWAFFDHTRKQNMIKRELLFTSFFSVLLIGCGYSQTDIYFGGQYSSILRTEHKVVYSTPNGQRTLQYEYIKPRIEAPGLIVTTNKANTRWEHLYSIVALEFDQYDVTINFQNGTTVPTSYSGHKLKSLYTQLEYGLRYRILKDSDGWFRPLIGLSVEGIGEHVRIIPYASNEFEFAVTNIALVSTGNLATRFSLGKRINLTLSAHMMLTEWSFESLRGTNPTLTTEQNRRADFSFDALPGKYRATLGVTYLLNAGV